ncbi:hypothetical protein DFJ74DRAFT_745890, partial [Hyaloraphidium curvatum]
MSARSSSRPDHHLASSSALSLGRFRLGLRRQAHGFVLGVPLDLARLAAVPSELAAAALLELLARPGLPAAHEAAVRVVAAELPAPLDVAPGRAPRRNEALAGLEEIAHLEQPRNRAVHVLVFFVVVVAFHHGGQLAEQGAGDLGIGHRAVNEELSGLRARSCIEHRSEHIPGVLEREIVQHLGAGVDPGAAAVHPRHAHAHAAIVQEVRAGTEEIAVAGHLAGENGALCEAGEHVEGGERDQGDRSVEERLELVRCHAGQLRLGAVDGCGAAKSGAGEQRVGGSSVVGAASDVACEPGLGAHPEDEQLLEIFVASRVGCGQHGVGFRLGGILAAPGFGERQQDVGEGLGRDLPLVGAHVRLGTTGGEHERGAVLEIEPSVRHRGHDLLPRSIRLARRPVIRRRHRPAHGVAEGSRGRGRHGSPRAGALLRLVPGGDLRGPLPHRDRAVAPLARVVGAARAVSCVRVGGGH